MFDGNKDPKPDRWLALFATACMLYHITTYQKPVPELVYMDFLNNYLLKNQIKEIKIRVKLIMVLLGIIFIDLMIQNKKNET